MRTDLDDEFVEHVNSGGRIGFRAYIEFDNETVQIDNDRFMEDTVEFQYDSCDSGFALGGAVAASLTFDLFNGDHKYTEEFLASLKNRCFRMYLYAITPVDYKDSSGVTQSTVKFTGNAQNWGWWVITDTNLSLDNVITIHAVDPLYVLSKVKVRPTLSIFDGVDDPDFDDILKSISNYLHKQIENKEPSSQGEYNLELTMFNSYKYGEKLPYTGVNTKYSKFNIKDTSSRIYQYFLSNSVFRENKDYIFDVSPTTNWEETTVLELLRALGEIAGGFVTAQPNKLYTDCLCFHTYNPSAFETAGAYHDITDTFDLTIKSVQHTIDGVIVQSQDQTLPVSPLPSWCAYSAGSSATKNTITFHGAEGGGATYIKAKPYTDIPVEQEGVLVYLPNDTTAVTDFDDYECAHTVCCLDNPLVTFGFSPNDYSIRRGATDTYERDVEHAFSSSLSVWCEPYSMCGIGLDGKYHEISEGSITYEDHFCFSSQTMTEKILPRVNGLTITDFEAKINTIIDLEIGDAVLLPSVTGDETDRKKSYVCHYTFKPNGISKISASWNSDEVSTDVSLYMSTNDGATKYFQNVWSNALTTFDEEDYASKYYDFGDLLPTTTTSDGLTVVTVPDSTALTILKKCLPGTSWTLQKTPTHTFGVKGR